MYRGFGLFLLVGSVVACGGESQGSKAPGGDGGAGAAEPGANEGGRGGGPAPPPAQGAFWANVKSVSPPLVGKTCPVGASLSFDLPAVDLASMPAQTLDADTYVNNVVDGEDMAEVKCSVKGASSFTLEGTIARGIKSLGISSGTLGADRKGTARITLKDSGTPGFSGYLSAPAANCTIDAAAGVDNHFQAQAGSIWAHFACASVEQAPSDYCQAEGYFVLENCDY